MAQRLRFVIIGGGLAGGKAAEVLRTEGFDGSVTLLAAEPEVPYERPPLSKAYLQGTAERSGAALHERSWYAENGVDLRLATTAESIERATQEVVTDAGERIGYDRLLIATGSRPRRLTIPGADLAGIHVLRTLADADSLKAALAGAASVAIVGGGWIGLEVAAAARGFGLPVTVVEQAELPLLRVLGPQVAGIFADLHRSRGVELITGAKVDRFVGQDGAVTGVALGDGQVVRGDVVVVGVGIEPTVDLAAKAGLQVDNGIIVDEALRSSDPAVLAAGDVANAYHPRLRRHIRVEHWDNALRQGQAAALSLLDRQVSYDRLPFFYTDQYDLGMEYVGHVDGAGYDSVVIRGDVPGLRFLAFWLSQGRLLAGMHVNVWDATDDIRALVESERVLDLGRLADADVPLLEV